MNKAPLPEIGSITYREFTLNLDFYLQHPFDEVGEASTQLPSVIEWINDMLQFYTQQELLEYHAIKQAEATAYFELRAGAYVQKYGDKMTEKALEMAVELDERVLAATVAHAEAKSWVTRLRNQISIFMAKLELIRTVEATRRHVDRAVSAVGV